MTAGLRQKMQESLAGRDISILSQKERQQIFQQMRKSFGGSFDDNSERAGGAGGPEMSSAPVEIPRMPRVPPVLSFTRAAAIQFTAAQRSAAQFPRLQEASSAVEILLRPGLLADAEIIIANLPSVLYIPYQAVSYEGSQPVVYVKTQRGNLETHRVRLGQRSESQIVVLEGLEEGQVIALEAPKSLTPQERTKEKNSGDGSSQPAFPGGGAPGGQAGRQR